MAPSSRTMRWIATTVAVVLGAALLAACGDDDSSDSGSGEQSDKSPIKIGRLSAKTGRLQTFDGPITQGLTLAVKDINAAGGIDGRKVELEVLDSAPTPRGRPLRRRTSSPRTST